MLLNKHLSKITVLASILLISNLAFADDKKRDKDKYKEKISKHIKKHNNNRGKKATQAALDEEIANRIAADQTLQNNINTISLTPGPQGATGAQGIQGPIGLTGAKGDAGIDGIQGIQGVQGDIGLTGAQGDKGDQGIQGIQGIAGDKGDKGDQGIAGINGSNGVAGTDGTSCSAIQGDGSATISCEDGTMASVYDGEKAPARTTRHVTGAGVYSSGIGYFYPPGRLLRVNKVSDTSDLRITYSDLHRAVRAGCAREVLIDGVSCPSGPIRFIQVNTSAYAIMNTASDVGYCRGVMAGQHTIKVRVNRIYGSGVCYTGGSGVFASNFLLEVEEVN